MLNTYIQYFQRKIGDGDWETIRSVKTIENNEKEEFFQNKILFMRLRDINKEFSQVCLWTYNLYPWDGKNHWSDGYKRYSYKRYDPIISLRCKFKKVPLTMEELFKFKSDFVIEYLKERGIGEI